MWSIELGMWVHVYVRYRVGYHLPHTCMYATCMYAVYIWCICMVYMYGVYTYQSCRGILLKLHAHFDNICVHDDGKAGCVQTHRRVLS